ncbi:MAG: mechanosensitive ion channel [Bacteroidales bacterium]|nr:mechanosensitive ion channel [Bacteroidales bacterium]
MTNKKRIISTIVLSVVLAAIPVWAVFREKDLKKTLSVLHFELVNKYNGLLASEAGVEQYEKQQHKMLVDLIENCNELAVMLYSQQQDFTFDLTYALDEVTSQYLSFNSTKMPYNEIVTSLESEIDRYEKLVQALKNLPPAIKDEEQQDDTLEEEDEGLQVEDIVEEPDSLIVPPQDSVMVNDSILLSIPSIMEEQEAIISILDHEGQAMRDSCLQYASMIRDILWERYFQVDDDNRYYKETDNHLKEAYNYAQSRYREVQQKIFVQGQRNYWTIIRKFPHFMRSAASDCVDKYSTTSHKSKIVSDWRGPMVMGFVIMILICILLSTGVSWLLVRILSKRVKYLASPWFQDRKLLITILAGIVIFAVTIMIVDITSYSNFINMALPLVAEFAWLAAAIFLSVLIRMDGKKATDTVRGYLPIIFMGLIIISFRIIFIPNSLINIIFPPILLLFSIWQMTVTAKIRKGIERTDRSYMAVSMVIMFAATIVSLAGYVMIALLVVIWWIFQFTLIQTVTAIFDLLSRYYDDHILARKAKWKTENPLIPTKTKGAFIEVSWLFDLCKMALMPILTAWTIPLCLFMAGGVFDLSSVVMDVFYKPFLNVEGVINISIFKIIIVVSMIFIGRYITYAAKAFYRIWRTRGEVSKLAEGVMFNETSINFTLADNIISLVTWGAFVIITFVMLQIPTSAITIISTGLATGIGFALKDVLNNFFYGMQLMSGRLRVGDVIECDGIRGTVDSMSYQSTQIQASDGSIIAFPNSTLFSKNFKNLTRNNAYEMVTFTVGVKYGTDVDKVRTLVKEALTKLFVTDKYGRDVVDRKKGITVRLGDFGDSSVDITVLQYVIVSEKFRYLADAKEIVYNTLNDNGIEIPFPQRDLYIKEMPGK